MFVLRPELRRPHEGLVVEACRDEPGNHAMEGAHIEAQRRPAVLARHFDAILQLHHRRPGVRVGLALLQDVDQRIHFLDACGIDAARPVILETPADQMHAVCQQRRGKRVAVVALILNAVEPECQRTTTVDQSAMIQPILLRHFAGSSIGAVRSTFSMACVSVSRVTRTHARQPRTCCQYSSCRPFGLRRM
ncbi:Uncharacterised protein [Bordetella pertussis]|nr:Uncharacterised protein [Bordetella pertussis]